MKIILIATIFTANELMLFSCQAGQNIVQSSPQISPIKSARYYYKQGVIKYDAGDKKGAVEDYSRAISIKPNYIDAYYNRGIAKSELGDKKGAIQDYDQAISINPNYHEFYNNAAFDKYDLSDIDGAIEYWRKSLKLRLNHPESQLALAIALYKKGQKDESYQLGIAVIKEDKAYSDPDFLRNQKYWSAIIVDDAIRFFKASSISSIY